MSDCQLFTQMSHTRQEVLSLLKDIHTFGNVLQDLSGILKYLMVFILNFVSESKKQWAARHNFGWRKP